MYQHQIEAETDDILSALLAGTITRREATRRILALTEKTYQTRVAGMRPTDLIANSDQA